MIQRIALGAALCVLLAGAPGLSAAADPYENYIRTSRDFQRVKQDAAFARKAWPTWIYLPWYYQWKLGYGDAAGKFQLAHGYHGVLVQGTAQLSGNRFFGAGGKQGSAIWVWDKSTVLASGNQFTGYRNALNASGSDVTATDNAISKFNGPAIIVRKPSAPPCVHGNTAFSPNQQDSAAKVEGAVAAADNVVKQPNEAGVEPGKWQPLWPEKILAGPWRKGQVTVQDGPWKLIVTHGKTTRFELFNTKDDPQQKTNLADKLEQITFRLRGLTERQWAVEIKAKHP